MHRPTLPRAGHWRPVVLVTIVGLLVVAIAAVGSVGATGGWASGGDSHVVSTVEPQTDDDVVIVERHDVTPDGTVTITHEIFLTADVTEIELEYDDGPQSLADTVLAVSGFDEADDDRLEFAWERSPTDPDTTVVSVEFALDPTAAHAYRTDEGRLLYGQLWYSGEVWGSGAVDVGYETELAADVEGFVTEYYGYVGPYTEYTETVDGTTYRIVVPDGEAPAAGSPAELATMYADAAGLFDPAGKYTGASDTDARMDEIVVFTPNSDAPYNGRAHRGGDSAWVDARQPIETAGSTWLHEYVHLQQTFDSAADFEWFIEGSADYYAAVLAVNLGFATVDEAVRELEHGGGGGDLADPDSWTNRLEYNEGARTAAAIDARIRAATDHERSLTDVWTELVDVNGPVDHETFLEVVADVADDDTADYADTVVTNGERAIVPTNPSLYTLPSATEAPSSFTADDDAGTSSVGIDDEAATADSDESGTDVIAEAGLAGVDPDGAVGLAALLFVVGVGVGWVEVVGALKRKRSAHSPLLALLWINALLLLLAVVAVSPSL